MRWSVPLGFVLAGVVAGCGGTASDPGNMSGTGVDASSLSKPQYERAVAKILESDPVQEAERLFFTLAAGDITAEECKTETRRFVQDVGEAIDAVADLNPPAEVAGLQTRLITAGRESEAKLRDLADGVEAGDVRCGQEWNERAYGLPSTNRAVAILAEYARRGYPIATNGE
jgi:hypothetical protein